MLLNTATGQASNGDGRKRLRSTDSEDERERQPKRQQSASLATKPLVVLALPSVGDDLSHLHAKLVAINDIILSGKSIAEVTNYQATTIQNRNATDAAVANMPPSEHCYWMAFIDGTMRLTAMDWSSNREPAPTSPETLKVYTRRAEALNRLYRTDQATEEHVAWITKHVPLRLPLVKAMARVIGAEINQRGGQTQLSATQYADLQTINRILREVSKITDVNRSTTLSRDMARAKEVLGAERRRLQALLRPSANSGGK